MTTKQIIAAIFFGFIGFLIIKVFIEPFIITSLCDQILKCDLEY